MTLRSFCLKGKIVSVTEKGYGFIRSDEGFDVFVHQKDVVNNIELTINQIVSFDVVETHKGLIAKSVKIEGIKLSPYQKFIVLSILFFAVVFSLTYFALDVSAIIGYLLSINMVGLLLFFYDKKIAGRKNTRIPERVLHTVTALGASISTTIAMIAFRHKTQKSSFLMIHWAIIAFQIAVLLGWYQV